MGNCSQTCFHLLLLLAHACSPPSFQGSVSLLPVEKWPFQTATKLEAKHCRDTWALTGLASSPRRGSGLSD